MASPSTTASRARRASPASRERPSVAMSIRRRKPKRWSATACATACVKRDLLRVERNPAREPTGDRCTASNRGAAAFHRFASLPGVGSPPGVASAGIVLGRVRVARRQGEPQPAQQLGLGAGGGIGGGLVVEAAGLARGFGAVEHAHGQRAMVGEVARRADGRDQSDPPPRGRLRRSAAAGRRRPARGPTPAWRGQPPRAV